MPALKKLEQKNLSLLETKGLKRNVSSEIADLQIVNEEITLSFASELPYLRHDWDLGAYYEVISVTKEDMDMTRFELNCPLLFNHNFDMMLGSVKKAWIDEASKKAYAVAKISSTRKDFQTLVDEGHLTNVSFMYDVTRRTYIGDAEDGLPIYRCEVVVLEVSLVSVAADPTVGIGRSKTNEDNKNNKRGEDMSKRTAKTEAELEEEKAKLAKEVEELEAKKAKLAKEVEDEEEEKSEDEEDNPESETETEEEKKAKAKAAKAAAAKSKSVESESKKISAAARISGQHELAMKFIEEGKTEVEYLRAVAALTKTPGTRGAPAFIPSEHRGKDDILSIQFGDYLEERATGLAGHATGMMKELSQEMRGKGYRSSNPGAIPMSGEYLRAKYEKSVADAIKARHSTRADQSFEIATPEAGGILSYTQHNYETLEQLEQKFLAPQIVVNKGTYLGVGAVTIQKKTGQVVSGLVNEGQYVDDTRINYDLLTFVEKTAQTSSSITRKARTQTNQDFEYDINRSMMFARLMLRDQQLLNGKGINVDPGKPIEVQGLYNTPGIKVVDIGDGTDVGTLSYQHILAMYEEMDLTEILNSYSGQVYLAGNARLEAQLRARVRFTNTGHQIMDKPGYVDDMQFVKSSSVADGKVATKDASKLLMIAQGAIYGMDFASEIQFDLPDRAGTTRIIQWDGFDYVPAYEEGIVICNNIARLSA